MYFLSRRFAPSAVLLGLLPLGLAGCMTVGPDYHGAPPSPAGTSHFVRHVAQAQDKAQAQEKAQEKAKQTRQTTPWWPRGS